MQRSSFLEKVRRGHIVVPAATSIRSRDGCVQKLQDLEKKLADKEVDEARMKEFLRLVYADFLKFWKMEYDRANKDVPKFKESVGDTTQCDMEVCPSWFGLLSLFRAPKPKDLDYLLSLAMQSPDHIDRYVSR